MFIGGFIKLKREILEWRWYTDINTTRLYLHILLTANYDSQDFRDITIHRGQKVASINRLVAETGLSEKEVRTALNHLKKTKDISVETKSKYSIITVNNYDKYVDTASDGQTKGKQRTSKGQQYNNKINKEKKKTSYDIDEVKKIDKLDFID